MSNRSSSGRGSLDLASSKASSQSLSSRGSLKSSGSFDEQPKAFLLEPAPHRRNSNHNQNNGKLPNVSQVQGVSFPPQPSSDVNATPHVPAPPQPPPPPPPPPPPMVRAALKMEEAPPPPLVQQSASTEKTLDQALDDLMEDVTNSKSSPPQVMKPSVQMREAVSFPAPNPPPPPPPRSQKFASTEKTLDQALDDLMEDVTNSTSSHSQVVKPTVQMEEAVSFPPPPSPPSPPVQQSASTEKTLDQALDDLMEDVTNSKSSPPQLVKPTVQIEEAVDFPPHKPPPPPRTQQPASSEKTLDQALDDLMEDFLPPPPLSLTASFNSSEGSVDSASVSFEFPPPPPPLPPTRGASISSKP